MQPATVVIATRNRAPRLRNCLDSLRLQSAQGRFEVVVVDNGSSDETSAAVAEHMRLNPHVRLLHVSQPNRAKARNAGIAAARGKYIIFCDDDTLAPEDFVAAHLRSHERRSGAVVTGPIINMWDPNIGDPPRNTGDLARNIGDLPRRLPSARHYSRAYFCTCNASAAKADIQSAGGFDEQYDLYGWEDTDLGLRLRSLGLRRIFDWHAYIYHIKPADAASFERRRALAIEKGRMAARFVRKAPRWPVKVATGAYALNFLRAGVVTARPLRKLYERALRSSAVTSTFKTFAAEALLDAAYVDALKSTLRAAHG